MTPPFVKKFDFRGVYNTDIFDKDAYYLGLAIIKVLNVKKVLIGWDTRVASKSLAMRFMKALSQHNVAISYLDMCSIDYVTAAANACDFDFSVMFTGSHNPWNWTGLLMHTRGGDSVQGAIVEEIIATYYEVQAETYNEEAVDLSKFDNFYFEIEKVFSEKIHAIIPIHNIKKLSVAVDLGDGSGTTSLSLLEKLLPQVTFTRINDRKIYDAASSHTADPSDIANMQDLIGEMKKNHYDAGFAFDSDADRVLAVDETGEYMNGSICGSAMVDVFALLNSSNQKVGYAVDCGPALYNAVSSLTNRLFFITPIPVGRSIIRQMIRDRKIDVGIENVGHFYLRDFFMTDSGAFSIVLILYWISMYGPLSGLTQKHPDGLRGQKFIELSPELEEKNTKLVEEIVSQYKEKVCKKVIVDGVRYEIFNGDTMESWFAIRQSGYEKIKKYFWGSVKQEEFDFLKDLITRSLP